MKKQLMVLAVSLLLLPSAFAKDAAKDSKAAADASQAAPDNTKKNARDRNGAGVTAQNQSNEKSDVEATRQLRQAIMQRKKLSVNAQNIKIITENGTMTLKGPVDSEQEKAKLERIAKQYSGHNKLVNELEVKNTNTKTQ